MQHRDLQLSTRRHVANSHVSALRDVCLSVSHGPHRKIKKISGLTFSHPQGTTEGARGDAGTSEAPDRGRVPGPGQPAAHHAGVPGAAAALHRDSARR